MPRPETRTITSRQSISS